MARALIALLLVACGGPAAPVEQPDAPDEDVPAPVVRLVPEGTRLSVELPAEMQRVAHALRWRGVGLDVKLADAQVPPGQEQTVAEAYLEQLARRHQGNVSHRPVGLAGLDGYEATIRNDARRVRTLMVWRDGAISRVTIVHDPEHAADAERVIDSVRFDPTRPIDAARALQLGAEVPEGMGAVPVTNEQLILRRLDESGQAAHAVGFPNSEPVLDVAVLSFPEGGRPQSNLARGQLLGSRFAGLDLGSPQVVPLEGDLHGFAIVSQLEVEGVALTLYGAYLEDDSAVVLVRASVATADAEQWLPRFGALTLSLRTS